MTNSNFATSVEQMGVSEAIHSMRNCLQSIQCGINLLIAGKMAEEEKESILALMQEEEESAREALEVLERTRHN